MTGRRGVLVLGVLALSNGSPGEEEAAHRGGPEHAGYYPGGLAGRGPEGADSVLYATTHPYPSGEEAPAVPAALIAVSGEDGALLWRRELGGRPTSPAVSAGLVLVGSDEGGVSAFDAATGALRWSHPTKKAVVGAPVVAGAVVYFGGGEDRLVHAVGLEDGKTVWTKKVKGEGVFSSVRVSGEALFAFSATHHAAPVLVSLAIDGGRPRWTKEKVEVTPISGPNDLELAGDVLLACVTPDRYRKRSDVTADGEPTGYLVAFDAASGEERWRVPTGPLAAYAPTVAGETAVCYARPLGAGDAAGPPACHVLAFSTVDGALRWGRELGPSPARWASASPVIAGASVLAASATEVVALDVDTGEERWTHASPGAVITAAGELVYLVAAGGRLTAVDAAGGTPRWRTNLEPVAAPGPGPPCPGEIAPPSLAD